MEPPFRLNLADRNWCGGSDKVDCLSESIRLSRKTLLIVTNAFARSEWGHVEMSFAQSKVIEANKDNMIVAVMEPIEALNLNPRLSLLMKRNGRLQWSEDPDGQSLFWEMLVEQMTQSNETFVWSSPSDTETEHLLRHS
jgi:hypothetical protein